MTDTMQAAFYTRQGPARDVLALGAQPLPEPGPGEVRVKLRTSGANPSDWKARGGARGRGMAFPLIVPHSDGAGDIDAVGPGVPDRTGERVWIWNGQWRRPMGTAAESIVLPANQAVRLPDGVSYAEGACLGIPALTARQALHLADPAPDATLLIVGGAGSVGHYAIQLAKRRKLRVITTVSSDVKAAHARMAGADETIDYKREDVGARVAALTGGRGADALLDLDLAVNGRHYPRLLRPHGTAVVYGMSAGEATLPSLWLMQNSITLRLFRIYDISAADRRDGIAEIEALLDAGALIHTIAARLPLAAIADAHLLGESGAALGNIVLDIPS